MAEFAPPELVKRRPPGAGSQAAGRLQRAPTTPPAAAAAPARSSTRVEGAAATVSWIDARSPAGTGALGVPDPAPPATLTESFITAQSGFRFANYLHGWLDTPDGVHVGTSGFVNPVGLFRGLSKFDVPSHPYPTFRKGPNRLTKGGVEGVDLIQTVGARTISPATAGTVVGGVPGRIVANAIFNFPPIWTDIRLTLMANGQRQCEFRAHSLFPSVNAYCNGAQTSTYTALAAEQTAWQERGWDGGNPWNDDRPVIR
jgi:hypothetical protein